MTDFKTLTFNRQDTTNYNERQWQKQVVTLKGEELQAQMLDSQLKLDITSVYIGYFPQLEDLEIVEFPNFLRSVTSLPSSNKKTDIISKESTENKTLITIQIENVGMTQSLRYNTIIVMANDKQGTSIPYALYGIKTTEELLDQTQPVQIQLELITKVLSTTDVHLDVTQDLDAKRTIFKDNIIKSKTVQGAIPEVNVKFSPHINKIFTSDNGVHGLKYDKINKAFNYFDSRWVAIDLVTDRIQQLTTILNKHKEKTEQLKATVNTEKQKLTNLTNRANVEETKIQGLTNEANREQTRLQTINNTVNQNKTEQTNLANDFERQKPKITQNTTKITNHESLDINTFDGVHGIRFFDNKLQVDVNGDWIKALDDGFPPKNVTNVQLISKNEKITIKWSDPVDLTVDNVVISRWAGTKVVYRTDRHPNNPNDGTLIIDNNTRDRYKNNGLDLNNLTNNTTYYITFFPYSDKLVYNYNTDNRYTSIPNPILPRPNLLFRGKNISNVDDFNDTNVNITWTGTPEVVVNGLRTRRNVYGLFDYGFVPYQEFTVSYTFALHNRNRWNALLNLAYTSSQSTFGFKIESNDSNGVNTEGIFDNNKALIVVDGRADIANPVELNKRYNIIVTCSRNEPVRVFLNGKLVHTYNQPDDKKGWNGYNHQNINKNGFNRRLSNGYSDNDCTHYDCKIWDVGLTIDQAVEEFDSVNKDYDIIRQETELPYLSMEITAEEPNPSTRCKYTGYLKSNNIQPNDPKIDEFIGHYPVLFKNGQEVARINPNNFLQTVDGDAINPDGSEGDWMIAFPRKMLKIGRNDLNDPSIGLYKDGMDDDFSLLAHKRGNVLKDKFYVGAYLGSEIGGKLRSLPRQTPKINITIQQAINLARANGDGYDPLGFYQLTYLQACYLLKFKNCNSQTAVGKGLTNNNIWFMTGGAEERGMDWGNQTGTNHVKCMGVEDLWGNLYQYIVGICVKDNGKIFTTTTNFNANGDNYKQIGYAPNGFSQYTRQIFTNNKTFLPKDGNAGTSSTYFCDLGIINKSNDVRNMVYGGMYNTHDESGIFNMRLNYAVNLKGNDVTCRLMYL